VPRTAHARRDREQREPCRLDRALSDLHVMSRFRHPFYNAYSVGRGGWARESRHHDGVAWDVVVDDDGDGQMADLGGDGRITVLDADLLVWPSNVWSWHTLR
jgi:hypothetical protein